MFVIAARLMGRSLRVRNHRLNNDDNANVNENDDAPAAGPSNEANQQSIENEEPGTSTGEYLFTAY